MHHGAAGDLVQHGGYDASVADPNADFWLEGTPEQMLDELADGIEQTLASAHELTGMDQVKTNYGFSGVGQTVAVIDSGIAYNHYALGGGLGSNYRVVGGYDFTENDSDPYDDRGPEDDPNTIEGSHGTHVAGIVGADDGSRSGVAPGVDLVGLRVFADNGAGYFSWVESALQWVHANRNAFENPITAVNLSLGTTWNSTSIPGWATLEDEFAQLKADGIFISVSAGNSYTSYNTPGLSYPAASPYVVPVMSSDDSGMLSYFSQRHQSAISAPGRYVYSTVPDYAGNNNGVDDDWANFSGTSMAAPYVAGASVIIREAMEFVGMTGIDQDDIFDLMMDTADSFYDSSTGLYYNRLNMQSAIDAIMPVDDFGNSVADAYNLGTITDGPSSQSGPMSGHIATIGDSDYFTFTAGATGTVTFAAQNTTHYMDASWDAMGADGQASEDGSSYTLNVVAGQQYSIALSSSDGLGYYDLLVTAESTFSYVDWGATGVQETKSGVNIAGDVYFRVVAGYDGYLTAEALQTAGLSGVQFVDSGLATVGSTASGRADYYATAGEELYLKVTGTATGVDFRLTNAVSVSGGVVTVVGTSGDDDLSFAAGATHTVAVNGVGYQFNGATYSSFDLYANGGNDVVNGGGSSAVDIVTMEGTEVTVESETYGFRLHGFNYSIVTGDRSDIAYLVDTALDDIFVGRENSSLVRGASHEYTNRVNGFGVTNAYARNGGYDRAVLYDTTMDDVYIGRPEQSLLRTADSSLRISAKDFDRVSVYSVNGGYDQAYFFDTPMNDTFVASYDYAVMFAGEYEIYRYAEGFDYMWGDSSRGGVDRAILYDSPDDDRYVATPSYAAFSMPGVGVETVAYGFAKTTGYSTAGIDKAYAYDSAGDDYAWLMRGGGTMVGASGDYSNTLQGFNNVNFYSTAGGNDQVTVRDSAADDYFAAYDQTAQMSDLESVWQAIGFDRVGYESSAGGSDHATLLPVNYALEEIGVWEHV